MVAVTKFGVKYIENQQNKKTVNNISDILKIQWNIN